MDKKISFGFSKVTKKPAIIPHKPPEVKKVELIDCLEEQSIKIKDAIEEVLEDSVLVIPIKDNAKNLLDRIKDSRNKHKESLIKQQTDFNEKPDSELSIEEKAVKALIRDAKIRLETNDGGTVKIHTLPIAEDKPTFEGETEASLEDYENVPIEDYGLAMLRGMGWKEGTSIGKNPTKIVNKHEPELRPKGLGLGATVTASNKPIVKKDKDGKDLILKKEAYAKIIAGANKGQYCQVQGLDDEAGRVIVKTAIKETILTLNEFVLVPVTKEEYAMYSKVLNNAKYEEYKEKSDRNLEKQRSNNESKNSSNSQKEQSRDRNGGDRERICIKISDSSSESEQKYNQSRKSRHDRSSSRDREEHYKNKSKFLNNYSESESSDHHKEYRRKSRKDKSKYRDRSRSNENYHYKKNKKSKSRNRAQSSTSSSSSERDNVQYKSKKKNKSSHSRHDDRDSDNTYKKKHHKKSKKKY